MKLLLTTRSTSLAMTLRRRDRTANDGGGVCFYLKNSINYTIRNDLNVDTLDNLCVEI